MPSDHAALSPISDSALDPALIQAYAETNYRVCGSADLTLRIGEAHPGLAELHRHHGVQSSAFITACNPYSEPLSNDENSRRLEALARELQAQGCAYLNGIGQHPSNDWPGEPSLLVLGLLLEQAQDLGRRHGQNAVVWCGADAVPQLVLLR